MSVIYIRDGFKGQDLKEIRFQDLEKYHCGRYQMAIAVGFRMLQAGLKELFGDHPPERREL